MMYLTILKKVIIANILEKHRTTSKMMGLTSRNHHSKAKVNKSNPIEKDDIEALCT
jgi:hypothetical protein